MTIISAVIIIWMILLTLWVYDLGKATKNALVAVQSILKTLAEKHGYKEDDS